MGFSLLLESGSKTLLENSFTLLLETTGLPIQASNVKPFASTAVNSTADPFGSTAKLKGN